MHEGSSCGSCSSEQACSVNRKATEKRDAVEKLTQNELSDIKHVLAVVSGKGGVGKSSVSSLMAIGLKKQGFKTGILDADITGPSIPKMFGLYEKPQAAGNFLLPVESKSGIRVMSLNLLLPQEDDPVIWRGPLIAGAVKQFWTEVAWGQLDYLIIDLPPGTGDVPLTVMQSLPLDGMIVVASPQDLALMVVKKALKMADMMSIPILGMVENMSHLKCPKCGEEIALFGTGSVEEQARTAGIRLIERLPLDPVFSKLCDEGRIEDYQTGAFNMPLK